jgi:hypothetical protein
MSLEDFTSEHQTIDLLTTRELLRLPPPTWLMDQLIPENGIVGLYGQPSGGKSFVALDWAMHISEGMAWLGEYPTKQAPVIYIAAEGGRGIQKRVRAWMKAYGKTDLEAMYFLVAPLYVREEGVVEAFLAELQSQDIYPGMVVLDTLSRSFGGGEENSSADMGHFIDSVIRLARGRYMSALIVHHTNATGSRERGHTSFRGALDAMFSCSSEKNGDGRIIRLTLKNDKQKDDVEAPAIFVQPVENVSKSLVFEKAPPPEQKKRGEGLPAVPSKASMLMVLESHPEGLTFTEWLLVSRTPKRTFQRRLKQMLTENEVFKDSDGRYYPYPTTEDLAAEADADE